MTDLPDSEPSSPPIDDRSIQIRTGARLHFGLLNTARPFGGVGVMIDGPATVVRVRSSDQFRCDAADGDRVRPIARRVAALAGLSDLPACEIEVLERATEHCGLGSGTQMSLATAEAICRFLNLTVEPAQIALQLAQRAARSTVGVHGYFNGGLLYETKADDSPLNQLRTRIELPERWCVAVFRPRAAIPQISGSRESDQFASLGAASRSHVELLANIVCKSMLPAAASGQFAAFTRAVHQYNRASGLLFESVQGGPYNGPELTDLVERLKHAGYEGVGQSSWGPGVFAWFESTDEATAAAQVQSPHAELVTIAHPYNQPRQPSR